MSTSTPRRTRFSRPRAVLTASVAILLAGLIAACSNTTTSSNNQSAPSGKAENQVTADTVDQAQLATAIRSTFLTDVDKSKLDPVVGNSLAVASQPLTPQQNDLLRTCLQQASCDTGHGNLTVALARDNANPWSSIFRAEFTAQAIAYPQVRKIVYTNANGNVAAAIANLRSLIAQRVDVIVTDALFGSAILPTVKQAEQAGIVFVNVNTPLPPDVASEVNSQALLDLCQVYTDGMNLVTGAVPGQSTYALYTGIPGNANAAAWQPCAEKVLTGAGWTKATEGFTQWTPQGDAQAANALLASGKNPGAIVYDAGVSEFLKPYIAAKTAPPAVFTDVVFYSDLTQFQRAQEAGVAPKCWTANSHAWYGRMGVTAGLMIKDGQNVPKTVTPPVPIVTCDSVVSLNKPNTPANAPVGGLLTPDQMTLALSVS